MSEAYDYLNNKGYDSKTPSFELHEGNSTAERFAAASQLLRAKAPDFYGMRTLSSTPSARFRIYRKVLEVTPDLDPVYQRWLANFDAKRTPSAARALLHGGIILSLTDKKQSEAITAEVPLIKLLRIPVVRNQLSGRLAEQGDPAMYFINTLESWRLEQTTQPSDYEMTSAGQSFEQFLASVHGENLSSFAQAIAQEQYPSLDTDSRTALA